MPLVSKASRAASSWRSSPATRCSCRSLRTRSATSARLTSQVTLAGRFLVLVPSGGMTGVSRKLSERERSRLKNIVSKIAPKDMGVIIRTAAEGASEDAIVKDLESLVRQWERINAKREEFWHGKRPKLLQGEPDVAIRVVRDIFNDDFSKLIVKVTRSTTVSRNTLTPWPPT